MSDNAVNEGNDESEEVQVAAKMERETMTVQLVGMETTVEMVGGDKAETRANSTEIVSGAERTEVTA